MDNIFRKACTNSLSSVEMKPQTRYAVIEKIKHQSEKNEKTEILIDYLEDSLYTIETITYFSFPQFMYLIPVSYIINRDFLGASTVVQ
jgi:hypothetical protein